MNPGSGFDRWIARRPWLARLMLVTCSLSLLATGPDDDGGGYAMPRMKSSTAPLCTLTADAPVCEYLVAISHDVPTSGQFFTINARANVRGTISTSGVTGDVPFVAVNVAGVDELNALTEFSLQRSLVFSGGCDAANTSSPCVSNFLVSFRRIDQGERGGSLNVSWELQLEARSASDVDEGGALPWTVGYIPQ